MNSGIIKRLIAVNMLYVNPSSTNQIRKKGYKGKKVIRSIAQQYLMSGVIFLAIYGITMVMIDFAKYDTLRADRFFSVPLCYFQCLFRK